MAWTQAPQTTSGEKSGSAQIATRSAYLLGLELNPPTTGLGILKVYDSENSSTAGKSVILSLTVAAGQNTLYLTLPSGRTALRGLYAELTGTTTYVVGYNLW